MIGIYKKEGRLLKTTNLEKKLKKLKDVEIIWSQDFSGSMQEGEAVLDQKLRELNNIQEDKEERVVKLFYFRNPRNGHWHISIYNKKPEEYWESKTKEQYEEWMQQVRK